MKYCFWRVRYLSVFRGDASRYTIPMPGDSPLRGCKAEELAAGGRYCLRSSLGDLVGPRVPYCELSRGRSRSPEHGRGQSAQHVHPHYRKRGRRTAPNEPA